MGGWWEKGAGGSRSGVVSAHISLALRGCCRNASQPQPFIGLIMMHSTQVMLNCGFFSLFAGHKLFLPSAELSAEQTTPPCFRSHISSL